MHFAHITKPGPLRLDPDQTYLLDDLHAGQYLFNRMASQVWPSSDTGHVFISRHAECPFTADPSGYYTASKSLLIVRSGGIGDLLMLTPALAELQRRHPHLRITVATHPRYNDALTLPGIHLTPYPIPEAELQNHDLILPLESLIEQDNHHDGATIWAHALGLISSQADPAEAGSEPGLGTAEFSLQPIYHPDPELILTAQRRFPKKLHKRHRIGIQIHASALNRSYPVDMTGALMDLLRNDWNCEIFLFGTPNKTPPENAPEAESDEVTILPNLEDPPDFATSAAILTTCDALIVPDSSLSHLAGALNLPTIALYGPFHWRQRTRHSPTVHALQGPAPCAPCHHHGWDGHPFPHDKPCKQKGYCLALAAIPPDRILAKLKQLLS